MQDYESRFRRFTALYVLFFNESIYIMAADGPFIQAGTKTIWI